MQMRLGMGLVVGLMFGPLGSSLLAEAPDRSIRPVARLGVDVTSVKTSPSPQKRPAQAGVDLERAHVSTSNQRFENWTTSFQNRAIAQGISPTVLDQAFAGIDYDSGVIKRDRNQSEFSKTLWEYLDSAVSDLRIKNGKAAMRENASALAAIEQKYGVDKQVVVAIWGLESAYGSFRGSNNTVQSLATLAFDARRAAFFEDQLIAALTILQNGDTTASNMTGSWAGAMGHTQFMPTSYLEHAVDFTGDGKRDIWSEDPTDALASTAAYLKHFGWVKGQPWGVEVTLSDGFDYALAGRDIERTPAEWAQMGVMATNGKPVPDHGMGSILLPAGSKGVAFMIFNNFSVIERYNSADAYVIGVGHLSDRIIGGTDFAAAWPRGDRALTFAERKELQRRLTAAGFDTQKIDGKIGPLTINAVRQYQSSIGAVQDGYASLSVLKQLQ